MAGPAGDVIRAAIGREACDLNAQQYCCDGLNFGYFYDRSPIIAYDGATQPAYTPYDFSPSSVPGCRAPHLWLYGDRSLYDALGRDYTLLRLVPGASIAAITAATARRRVPLTVVDIDVPDARTLYGRNLALVRPDQHVAWRGDEAPTECIQLIDQVRGATTATI